MANFQIGKRFYLPPTHSGHDLGSCVFTPEARRNIATDLLIALAAKHLDRARDTSRTDPLGDEGVPNQFMDDPASNAQAGIDLEVAKDGFEVFGFKRNVSVDIADAIVSQACELL